MIAAILTIVVAGVLVPLALIALVGLNLDARQDLADDQSDSDRAASFAEFNPTINGRN